LSIRFLTIIGISLLYPIIFLFGKDVINLTTKKEFLKSLPSNHVFIKNKGQIIDQDYKPNPVILCPLSLPEMNAQLNITFTNRPQNIIIDSRKPFIRSLNLNHIGFKFFNSDHFCLAGLAFSSANIASTEYQQSNFGGGGNEPFLEKANHPDTNGCPALSPAQFDITIMPSSVNIGFIAPDTTCTGNTINILNTTTGGTTYYWNFCSGNTNSDPSGVNIGNPGSLLDIPTYLTLVKQDNECFSFISCQQTGIVRYYHGGSFKNNPISWTALGKFGILDFDEEGIQVKYDNGQWYGFVNSDTTIIKLNFGTSLWNTPTAINLNISHVFNMTHGLAIIKEGETWLGFVTCSFENKIYRLNFGNNLSNNTPVLEDLGNPSGFISPGAIYIVEENSIWYMIISAGGNTLSRLVFGNSLLNIPTGQNLGNPGGFNQQSALTILRDCESTSGYFCNYLVNGQLGKLTFPSGVTGSVTGQILGNIGSLNRPHSFSEIFRLNDTLYAYITNRGNGTLTRLTFPPCTNSTIQSSTQYTPPPFSYNYPGTYNIRLFVDEGLPTQESICKPVVVMDPPSVNLGIDTSICPGTSKILDAGAGFSNYLWSTGQMTRTIIVSTPGRYWVNATRWGCTATDTIFITFFNVPVITLGPDTIICAGSNITFDAGTCSSCTYQWANLTTGQMNIGTEQTYTTGKAGEYMVSVNSSNNCIGRDTIQLSIAPVPIVTNAPASKTICSEDSTNIVLTSNIPGANFYWTASLTSGYITGFSPDSGLVINQILINYNSTPGVVTYNITPKAGSCIGTPSDYEVKVNPVDSINISIAISANNICAGDSVTIIALPVNGGTSPSYQWKVNGMGVGTNSPYYTYTPSDGDLVNCELTSSESCTVNNPSTSNIITMVVNPNLPISVSISTSSNPVCAGTSVTYTATPTNGGTIPAYQWKVNGMDSGTNNSTYTFAPLNGDLVSCVLTSSEPCTSNNPATSTPILMVVEDYFPVGIAIDASSNPSCQDSSVTFIATSNNGGSTPFYQWKVNGIDVGTNSPTYSYAPANNDIVYCYLTSNLLCTTNNPATSNTVTMSITDNLPAGVTIVANPNPFCPDNAVNFIATPVNGGITPVYQWKVNGVDTGTNSPGFSFSPHPGDSIWCTMTSNLSCISGNPAISSKIAMIAFPAPHVIFSRCFDSITTINAKPIQLKGGIPLGGTYSGVGVNSTTGVFTPLVAGIGTVTLTYLYTNVTLCSSSDSKTIVVRSDPSFTCGNNLIDIRDGNVYPTVQIGSQCWMDANLNYGTMILSSSHQRDNCIPEKYCTNDLEANCQIGTAVYQWDELIQFDVTVASQYQGICPPGWHIPSANDFQTLIDANQGNSRAGTFLTDLYLIPRGFDALLKGMAYLNTTWAFTSSETPSGTLLWTSTPGSGNKIITRGMNNRNQSVSMYETSKANAFSVRCLKD